jgi:hypothetical protein
MDAAILCAVLFADKPFPIQTMVACNFFNLKSKNCWFSRGNGMLCWQDVTLHTPRIRRTAAELWSGV